MCRVALLGIAGGGKSTLARQISAGLDLPLHQMDKIGWQPGWSWTPSEEINRRHAQIIANDKWVIDGFGTPESIVGRCDAADTLILIDQPAWRHYWWAYKRNIKLLFRQNPDLPAGCSKWPLWKMMFGVIRQTRRNSLPELRRLLTDRPDKGRFVLRSPREIRAFRKRHLSPTKIKVSPR
jgi:adenylate kinase family enzyme